MQVPELQARMDQLSQAEVEQQQASQQQLAEQQQVTADVQTQLSNAEQTIVALNSQSGDEAAAHSAEVAQLQQEVSSLRAEHTAMQDLNRELQELHKQLQEEAVQVPELQAWVEQLSLENLAQTQVGEEQQQASQQQLQAAATEHQQIVADLQAQFCLATAEQQQVTADVQAQLTQAQETVTALNNRSSDAAAAHIAEVDKLQREVHSLRAKHSTLQELNRELQGEVAQVPKLHAWVDKLSLDKDAQTKAEETSK